MKYVVFFIEKDSEYIDSYIEKSLVENFDIFNSAIRYLTTMNYERSKVIKDDEFVIYFITLTKDGYNDPNFESINEELMKLSFEINMFTKDKDYRVEFCIRNGLKNQEFINFINKFTKYNNLYDKSRIKIYYNNF